MGKKFVRAILGGMILLFAISGLAQEFRATLTGQVADSSGAVIPGANVKAVNNASGTAYAGKTSAKGVYYIPYVLPGVYTVTAQASGFNTVVQDKVTLLASQTFNQNFSLPVGEVDQKVVVHSAPPLLETATGSGGTVISERELQSLPVQGESAYTLIGTTPGSQFTQTSFGTGGYHGTTGWDVTNQYTLGGGG